MMSETTLRVLNALPESEKGTEISSKASTTRTCINNAKISCTSPVLEDMSERPLKVLNGLPESEKRTEMCRKVNLTKEIERNETEVGNIEVEYVETENLVDVEDASIVITLMLEQLESKEWVVVCDALNNVRRVSVFHKESLTEILGDVIALITKSLKNPRSAVCKTAIMTAVDIFKVYGDSIIDSFDPLLVQLFLKSSQDKRFVCDAAERALMTMTMCISPTLLLPKLQPYIKNRNPRIRAKASKCFAQSVLRMGFEGIRGYGVDKLLQVAVSQLSDQLPESRESARILTLKLKAVYEKSQGGLGELKIDSWRKFCESVLDSSDSQIVLRVTCGGKEGPLACCNLDVH